jgi:DNA-binding response OmpR family regulator
MTLQTLLVTKDDDSAELLCRVLASFAVAVERFSEVEIALQRLGEQRFDGLIVDFDEPDTARALLQAAFLKPGALITMALLSDERNVRETLHSGAKFIMPKPVVEEQAAATLCAVTAMFGGSVVDRFASQYRLPCKSASRVASRWKASCST